MQPTVRQEVQPQFEHMIGANFGEQAAIEAQHVAPVEAQIHAQEQVPSQISEGLMAAFALSMQLRSANQELANQILGMGVKSEVVNNAAVAFARQQEMDHQAREYTAKQNKTAEKRAFASAE